jgi:hypothetical protein
VTEHASHRRIGPRPSEFTVTALLGGRPLAPDETIEVASLAMIDAWCHRLGPTAVLLWVRLATVALANEADHGSDNVIDVETTRASLGVQSHIFWRALDRLAFSGKVRWCTGDTLGVDVITGPPKQRTTDAPALRA